MDTLREKNDPRYMDLIEDHVLLMGDPII